MRCELHLVRRRGELEGHGEHQGDGAEGLQPLGPLAGGASASTPTWSVDGRRLARLGTLSPSSVAAPALADAIRESSSMVTAHEWAAAAELVQPGTARRERGPEVGRWKVNVLSAFLVNHSWNHPR